MLTEKIPLDALEAEVGAADANMAAFAFGLVEDARRELDREWFHLDREVRARAYVYFDFGKEEEGDDDAD